VMTTPLSRTVTCIRVPFSNLNGNNSVDFTASEPCRWFLGDADQLKRATIFAVS
jgi:hypothetical protein